ncbi:MAG: AEC family transporter [Oscillospiraceae bacterium]|nr:AEC family transporter [Oscillospiraceae bacterium]
MELSTLLGKMLVFAVLMLIGYLMARRGVIGPAFTRTASSLVLNVFMVGTILNSMISTGAERDLSNLPEIILMTFMMTLIGYATAWIVTRLVRIEPANAPSFEILMGVGNSMFIALPIAGALYGAYAVFIVSLSCIPFNVFLYSYGVWRIRGTETGKLRVKDMFSIPLIATLLGLLILVLDLSVPKVIVDIFSSLSGATMPMSMMVIGASLGSVSLLDAFHNPKLAILSAVRLILIPILTWVICRFLTDDPVLLMTCMIIAASPSAVIVSVIAIQYGRDGVFASEAVQHSTICSIVTIPLLIQLFSGIG